MKPHLMPRSYCPLDNVYVRWDPVRERVTITFNPLRSIVDVWYRARELWKHYEGRYW